jgi:hypothetical protein
LGFVSGGDVCGGLVLGVGVGVFFAQAATIVSVNKRASINALNFIINLPTLLMLYFCVLFILSLYIFNQIAL